jgi:hypothetical protein
VVLFGYAPVAYGYSPVVLLPIATLVITVLIQFGGRPAVQEESTAVEPASKKATEGGVATGKEGSKRPADAKKPAAAGAPPG